MRLNPHEDKTVTPKQRRFNKMTAYCYVSIGINAALAFLLMRAGDYNVLIMAIAGLFSAYTSVNSDRGGKTSFVLALIVAVFCTALLSFFWGYNLHIALLPASALEIGGAFLAWRRFSADIS